MNTFTKALAAIAAITTLGATVLTSTQASAWCGDQGYGSYDSSPSYNSDADYGYNDGYGSYGYDHHDRYGHRGFEHNDRFGHRDFSRRH